MKLSANIFPFASLVAMVDAVAALATAVPVGSALNTGAEENVFTAVIVSVESRYIASPSLIAVLSCAFVNDPRTAAFPVDVICPVRFAFVVTVAALPFTLHTIVEENVCVHVNVCAESVRARVAFVVGNVIVVSAVPASFVAVVSPSYLKFHEAEVVQDVSIQVRRQDAPDAIDTILFAHEEFISKIPVLLLTM